VNKKKLGLIMLLSAIAITTVLTYKALENLSQLDLDDMFNWDDNE
jgi:hypothetical protein